VWVGGPLPAAARKMIDSWKHHHPGWEFRLWTDTNLPPMPHLGPYFQASPTRAGQADILRCEIVYAHGGIYVDADMECLRPIENLLGGCRCFVACEYDPSRHGLTGPTGINNNIFGAVPKHPAILDVMQQIPSVYYAADPLSSGPALFRHVMHRRTDVRIFEKSIFNPLLPQEAHARTPGDPEAFPDSYAVHWCYSTWHTDIACLGDGSQNTTDSPGIPAV